MELARTVREALKRFDITALRSWYRGHARDLDFRRNKDAYRIWLAETMLQQTRVAAMLPRYREFLVRFPDLRSLAEAGEEQVLAAWRGLGYYSRARNLHLAAKRMVAEFSGRFPDDPEEARSLPGVGPYTAAAVLSIAYNAPQAVLDGNVRRVLVRLFGLIDEDRVSPTQMQHLADVLLQNHGPPDYGEFNQAMMELGATICLPGLPDCDRCPLRSGCTLYARGGAELAAQYPEKKRLARIDVSMSMYVVEQGGRLLLCCDAEARFLKGQWTLPAVWTSQGLLGGDAMQAWLDAAPLIAASAWAGAFRHSITCHDIDVQVFRVSLAAEELPPNQTSIQWRWVEREQASHVAISSMTAKALRLVADFDRPQVSAKLSARPQPSQRDRRSADGASPP